jgi:very-short-patch-repair endonuclease
MAQEGERLELLVATGRLVWNAPGIGEVDHPILLQRVELSFDPSGPSISVIDAEQEAELYLPVLAIGAGGMGPQDATALREELSARQYHPLESVATPEYLQRIARLLHARGEYHDSWSTRLPVEVPHLALDPMLLLRVRGAGFAAAISRVLVDIDGGGEIPVSLSRLVGFDHLNVDPLANLPPYSPWGEPPDVLLSKLANAEQVQIAQALARYRAVLVQGPPGTGKSHTIANLIGHLVAEGKRVLVTSHTTKALSVLRDKVEPQLQPLCLALLDNDSESRKQLEQAVRTILSRLTQSSAPALAERETQLTRERERLLAEVARCTDDLRTVREAEYRGITVGGDSVAPADAARWLVEKGPGHGWIEGWVQPGAPLPLSDEELRWLYESNGIVSAEEEREIGEGLPDPDALPTLSEFESYAGALYAAIGVEPARWFDAAHAEEEHDVLEACERVLSEFAQELESKLAWQRVLIGAGHSSDPSRALWEALAESIDASSAFWRQTLVELNEHEPAVRDIADWPADQVLAVAREIAAHVQQGGGTGVLPLLFNGRWRQFVKAVRVQGRAPRTAAEFRAVVRHLELEAKRQSLAKAWRKTGEPAGLPALDGIETPWEQVLTGYAAQIRDSLGWWERRWGHVARELRAVGFRWEAFRQHEVAFLPPAVPFVQDVTLTTVQLRANIQGRLQLVRRLRAQRIFTEVRDELVRYRGPVVGALREAVEAADPVRYGEALAQLSALRFRTEACRRRSALLEKLGAAATGWTQAIRARSGAHGEMTVPGDTAVAWRWRQFAQELDRRAALDETTLMQRLHDLRMSLRTTTVNLIDQRAWLGQVKRVNLPAQQALQGWAQIQRKIGKGTGKRVPELQVAARRQLALARDAVPVWIMPLSRVAESIDLSRERFDVVIVDEASQSDVLGLLAWYLGKSVVVVGDDQQVSPLAVGQSVDAITAMRVQYLAGIPNAETYDAQTSIYDLAGQCFGGTIALREHFRCVPDIIEFSNQLAYEGTIRPLRDPTRVPRPHVVEVVADASIGGLRDGKGKVSLSEARLVVALLKAGLEHPRFRGATFGAITLLGDEQAKLIQDLALQVVGAVALDNCRFAAGNSAQFQGDERSVIFLSMVDAPQGRVLVKSSQPATRQRYNVAASRAQDQLWLVHSLDPDRDLQQGDLRRQLIEHVRNPGVVQDAVAAKLALTESPFERAVLEDLVAAGYDVLPQVVVGRYRLDFVVRSGDKQVAFECDGDRYHGFEKIPDDLARQAVLERAGWRFVRIRGTQYYRDRDRTMRVAIERLSSLGIEPRREAARAVLGDAETAFRDEMLRRAWEIIRAQGWVRSDEEVGNAPDS